MIQAVSRGGVSRAERDEAGITVGAERKGGNVVVTIAGGPAATAEMPAYSLFIQEAIAAAGGTTSARRADDRVFFTITLPAADRRVLVLEDNTDLVHLYRRYTTATRYEIVYVSVDEDILHMAQTISPDAILMDILLPNVDGWELLSLFHEHPATRPIPVIICSVVRREELSLALGAALYLQKPVSLPVFIQALDQVLQETAPIA